MLFVFRKDLIRNWYLISEVRHNFLQQKSGKQQGRKNVHFHPINPILKLLTRILYLNNILIYFMKLRFNKLIIVT